MAKSVKFPPLPLLHDEDHRMGLLWEMPLKLHVQNPNWQGMM